MELLDPDTQARINMQIATLDRAWSDGWNEYGTETDVSVGEFGVAVRYCHLFFTTMLRMPNGLPTPLTALDASVREAIAALNAAWQGAADYDGKYDALTDHHVRALHVALKTLRDNAIHRGVKWTI